MVSDQFNTQNGNQSSYADNPQQKSSTNATAQRIPLLN
jgi:hypothetical protein